MDWNQLQSLLKEEIQSHGSALAPHLNPDGSVEPEQGIKIYRDAFYFRMCEFLETDYPQCFACWKEGERKAVVRGYGLRFPSISPNAADFGSAFPEYLADRKWPAELSFLPDLGLLERALLRARYAPILLPEGFDKLAIASEQDFLGARFHFDPSFFLMESEWPLLSIYREPGAAKKAEEKKFVVYRDEGDATFRPLHENEYLLLKPLSLGIPLGEVLAHAEGLELQPDWLADWVSSGMLQRIEWPHSA